MLSTSKTLDAFIDEALAEIVRYDERGYGVTTSSAMTLASTTLTSDAGAKISPTDVIEIGSELMLVSAVSADVIPVLTVSRGYDNTTIATHASGVVATVNPSFTRKRVGLAIQRAFPAIEAGRVFNVVTESLTREPGMEFALFSVPVRDVLRVGYMDGYGRFEPVVDGWRFFDDMPTSTAPNGQIIRVPRYVNDDDELVVTYSTPFRWSSYPASPSGTDTMTMPEGSEHLPCQYAVAWLAVGRELSRQDIDRTEEWNRSQGYTSGLSTSLIKQMWAQFYQALANAARLYVPEVARPYRRTRRFE